jgi:signal transduction histidine kinase
VHADPTLMQHAVRNILENAFKFGARQVEVSGRSENGTIVFGFKDDGPGIPPEDHERVFERFYQVEKTFCGQVPGAGLGLTMVKQTAEAHGGKVWVESELEKGTAVFLQLPASSGSSSQPNG